MPCIWSCFCLFIASHFALFKREKKGGNIIWAWCFIWIQGGSWCNNITTCSARTKTRLGSSKYMSKQVQFSGLLGKSEAKNPGIYSSCLCFELKFLLETLYQCKEELSIETLPHYQLLLNGCFLYLKQWYFLQ